MNSVKKAARRPPLKGSVADVWQRVEHRQQIVSMDAHEGADHAGTEPPIFDPAIEFAFRNTDELCVPCGRA